jgi:cobalt-precorrin 5A hydrolase
MKASIFAYTRHGVALALKIEQLLLANGFEARVFTLAKFLTAGSAARDLGPSPAGHYQQAFQEDRLLVFIGATGIAIRSIAPYVKSKATDPAVLSLDEQGTFVIPLLSGHIGGANALALKIAQELQATPVLTTATDVNKLFAVDEWATRHNMAISSLSSAKTFAAYLVDGQTVGVCSDFPVREPLPKGLQLACEGAVGLAISLHKGVQPFVDTLVLRPRILHLGIGCRKGISMDAIEKLVLEQLQRLNLTLSLVTGIASIDVKKEEPGLLAFAREYALPFHCYTATQLQQVAGTFTPSAFVARTVGVDNVCERAAVLDSKGGKLLLKKTSLEGVTLAIAQEDLTVDFND